MYGAKAVAYLGLLLIPLVLIARPQGPFGRPAEGIALVVSVVAFVVLAAADLRMPLSGNVLHEAGVGPITLHGCQEVFAGPAPAAPWWIATAVGCFGAAGLPDSCFDSIRAGEGRASVRCSSCSLPSSRFCSLGWPSALPSSIATS